MQCLSNFTVLHFHDLFDVVAEIRQLSLFPVNLIQNITRKLTLCGNVTARTIYFEYVNDWPANVEVI